MGSVERTLQQDGGVALNTWQFTYALRSCPSSGEEGEPTCGTFPLTAPFARGNNKQYFVSLQLVLNS